MGDFLNEIRFHLEVLWTRLQHEISGHGFQIVAAVAVIVLLWMFIGAGVRNRR